MARLVPWFLVLAVVAVAPVAAAEDVSRKQCADSYVRAQEARKESQLRDAREALVFCAQEGCMKAVKKDCIKWLDEVESAMPSISVQATGPDGTDALGVSVYQDDQLIADKLTGRAIDVDPGQHTFRFELEGQEPIERELLILEGRKSRIVEISWQSEDESTEPTETEPETTTQEVTADTEGRKPGVLVYALGGGGVAALAITTGLWLKAEGDRKDLEGSGCEPNCSQGKVDGIERKRLVGDIFLGVGVASLGLATYFYFVPPKGGKEPAADEARLRVDVAPTRSGAHAVIQGRF